MERPAGREWVFERKLDDPALGGGEGGELFYYVFDVLFADGRDVRSLPLEERRAVLEGVLGWRDPLRMTERLIGDAAALLADACRDGWEGLIAKRRGTPYVSTRSRDWLKLKCTRAHELVIGGFTAPRSSPRSFAKRPRSRRRREFPAPRRGSSPSSWCRSRS